MLMTELVIAMAMVVIAVLPVGYSFISEGRALRAIYLRTVAMEIVDGEMEILAAGHWRDLPEGAQPYTVAASSAANLPSGKFQFTRQGNRLRLEWSFVEKRGIGTIVREATTP